MLPFPSYYSGLEGSCSSKDVFLQGLGSAAEMISMDGGGGGGGVGGAHPTSSSRSTAAETKACKSHKEAERRRRQRINGHLSTLRTLLPNTTKTDKASLLAEVVQHMKELTADVAAQLGDTCSSSSSSNRNRNNSIGNKEEEEEEEWWWSFPGEKDEVRLQGYCDKYAEAEAEAETCSMIRASLSCEDRADLMSDLTQALRSVGAKVVKAEMATVGGRMKTVLVIQRRGRGRGRGKGKEDEELGGALKAVIEKAVVSDSGGQALLGNKRPRLSQSQSQSQSHLTTIYLQ